MNSPAGGQTSASDLEPPFAAPGSGPANSYMLTFAAPTRKAVFPRHASQDAEAAQRICDALRAAGIKACFDKKALRGGDAWDWTIRQPQWAPRSTNSMTERQRIATRMLQDKLRMLRSFTTLSILFMGAGCIFILPYLSAYLYIPMKDAMHLDNMRIGLMGSAMGFTAMIFYWPGGWIADRVSPRKLIAFSLIAHGLLGLWLATLPSFKVLLTIQLLMGVFLTLTYWSAVIKLVRQLAPSDQQARYFGAFEGGRNVTAVAFVAAGLYLFDWLGGNVDGLRATIMLFSGMLLAIGALSWIHLPEITAAVTTASIDRGQQSLPAAIARVVRMPAVWLAMLIILCAYATSAGSTYLTPYATDVYGQSVFFGGVLSVIIQATGIFAPPAAGFIADRWTTSRTTLWLLVALAACLFLFVMIPGSPRLYLLLLINSTAIGCALYALRGIYFALLEEGAVPLALTGTATGLISVVAYTPDVFMPVLAGHLLDRYGTGGVGYRYFFLILALFAVAGVGFTLMFRYCTTVKLVESTAAPLAERQ